MIVRSAFVLTLLVPAVAAAQITAPATPAPAVAAPAATAAVPVPDADLQAAKSEFENAQTLFIKEQFNDAAAHFLGAFARKPFAAFLFNAAVSYEKAQKLEKAGEFFQKYLDRDPAAPDAASVKTRIEAIKTILAPIGAPGTPAVPGAVATPTAPLPVLPAIETKGLVVIDSKPQGATIYLDNKTNGVFGKTPWQGSLESKPVKLILEAKGFKSEERSISPRSDKLVDVYIALSEEHFLGWVEIASNVPGADVFIDRKDIGAIGKTPFTGHLKPGKHTVFLERMGFKAVQQEIDVLAGTATQHMINLDKGDNGWINVAGRGAYGANVSIDKKFACAAPCRTEVTPGLHQVVVQKGGFEDYEGEVRVDRSAETVVEVQWSPRPSKRNAYTTAAIAAGFLGGGLYVGYLSNKNHDGIQNDIKGTTSASTSMIDSNDPRFSRGKWEAIGADVLFGVAALLAISSAVSFFSHGPESAGAVDQRQVGFGPGLTSDGAGVAAWGRF
ncbi:MAG TPA: PEGA domain-containing protein [Polyangia bacterium]